MASIWLNRLIIVIVGLFSRGFPQEFLKCIDNHLCVPLSQCHVTDFDKIIYPCHSGFRMVCCPPGAYLSNVSTSIKNRKTSLFPVNCGTVMVDDKISGGKKAELGQFPWMALLGYRQRQVNYTQFLCGGSIITENYILTAAHCITLDRRLELVVVRLGEHDLTSERDCIRDPRLEEEEMCAAPHVDNPIEHIRPHPNYDNERLQNDIALIKVRQRIRFTDYVKPICLPFERNLEKKDLSKQKFTVSGWGKTNANNLGGSTSLQYAVVTVWNQTACQKNVPPDVKPIRNTQLCANGGSTEDACKGDSGGPLVNATIDSDGELRYFQVGVVSFASSVTCGDPNLPTIYTRVDKYLDWIEENVS